VIAGLLAAGQAAAASLVVVLVPVVLTWATASYSQAPWGQAVQTAAVIWLLAHHTAIAFDGGQVGLMPIGGTLIPLLACWFAGVRLSRTLDPNAAAIRAGVGRKRPALPPLRAMLSLILGYAALVTTVSGFAVANGVRPVVAQAFLGGLVICGVGATTGAAAWLAGGVLPGLRRIVVRLRLPDPVRRCLRPLALALTVHGIGAVVILGTALVLGWHRILTLQHDVGPGVLGGLVLAVAQVTVVPNLLVWAGAFAAGPGFAVGTGTAVTPGQVQLGPLPTVPVLGALPTPGDLPVWAWAVLALPVLGGLLAGYWIVENGISEVRTTLQDAATTALLAGGVWAVLGWLSGGPAGPGRLAQLGPSPWRLGLAVAAEVGAGALLSVGAGLATHFLAAPEASPPTTDGTLLPKVIELPD
jgi:Family of unknown function (DUF6350)